MSTIDTFAVTLFEQAKRFLERAQHGECDDDGKVAFLTAALLFGVSSLEAHVNAVADEMLLRSDLTVLDKSILGERDYKLDSGEFVLTDKLKMYRLLERVEFIVSRFTQSPKPQKESWWPGTVGALDSRNKIVHAKDAVALSEPMIKQSLRSILDCVNALYLGVYGKGLPSHSRGLQSKLSF